MKIFCNTCAFVRSGSEIGGIVYYRCKKAKTVKVLLNAIQRGCINETNEEKNKDNNCKDYRRRRWYECIWANCNG